MERETKSHQLSPSTILIEEVKEDLKSDAKLVRIMKAVFGQNLKF